MVPGPSPSRRQAHLAEALCMGCGMVFLVASFFMPHLLVTLFRVGTGFALVCGYLLSVSVRIVFLALIENYARYDSRFQLQTRRRTEDDHHRRMPLRGSALHRSHGRYCNQSLLVPRLSVLCRRDRNSKSCISGRRGLDNWTAARLCEH